MFPVRLPMGYMNLPAELEGTKTCEIDTDDNSSCTFSNVMDSYSFHRDLLQVNASLTLDIKKINFKESFMDNVPKELSIAFPNVESLDLSNTNLERLENYDFVSTNKIISLNASNNKIYKLGARITSVLTVLESLDLSHNLVERINPVAFTFKSNFKFLNLSHNRISKLDKNILEPLRSLEVLRLDHNLISEIEGNYKSFEPNWKELYLQHNNLMTLDAALVNSVALLDVSLNRIQEASLGNAKMIDLLISDNELKALTVGSSLEKLSASGNKLNLLQVSFEGNVSLTYLDLADCRLSNKEKLMSNLKKFKNLQYLDLTEAEIILDKFTFKGLRSLQTLILTGAIVGTAPTKVFADLDGLISLDLSENSLKSFDVEELKNSRNLEILKLRNAFVAHLDGWKNITGTLPKLQQIDIYENLFNCERLPSIIEEFQKLDLIVIDIDEMGQTEYVRDSCIDEETHKEQFPSHYETSSKLLWYFVGFFLICLTVAAIVFTNKRFDIYGNVIKLIRCDSRHPASSLLREDM